MATYKKQLHDKDGNMIYPDVGIPLDNVVLSADPEEVDTEVIDPNSYSTSETLTGGYWIDGRKIYKKTINFGALPNNTTKNVAHNISNLENVIEVKGWTYALSQGWFPLPFASTGSYPIEVKVTATNVAVVTTIDRSGIGTCYITLYYTKTTG